MLSPRAGAADSVVDKVCACILYGPHNITKTLQPRGKERKEKRVILVLGPICFPRKPSIATLSGFVVTRP